MILKKEERLVTLQAFYSNCVNRVVVISCHYFNMILTSSLALLLLVGAQLDIFSAAGGSRSAGLLADLATRTENRQQRY
jgi:putative exporter of polyketide antibiotics